MVRVDTSTESLMLYTRGLSLMFMWSYPYDR